MGDVTSQLEYIGLQLEKINKNLEEIVKEMKPYKINKKDKLIPIGFDGNGDMKYADLSKVFPPTYTKYKKHTKKVK